MWVLIAAFLVTLAGGIIVGLSAYGRFLARLKESHPDIFEELGEPTLFMADPGRGARLQRFIFSKRATETGDRSLAGQCRFLRVFVFALVGAVFVEIAFGIWMAMKILSP